MVESSSEREAAEDLRWKAIILKRYRRLAVLASSISCARPESSVRELWPAITKARSATR